MQYEMKSLHDNHPYEPVNLPKGKNALNNKWVSKIKHEENSTKLRYKATLVMKGFDRKKYIDFDKIFSPVVKMSFVMVVLALVASMDFEVEQLDVKVFVHDDLEETIYMEQPEGLKIKNTWCGS